MKLRPALAAALLLPLIGLGAGWMLTHQKAQRGTEWEVPIAGYDPRDLLRGHYIQYRYEWPGLVDRDRYLPLCLNGSAPALQSVTPLETSPTCPGDFVSIEARTEFGALDQGRYYVPQTLAAGLEAKLRDPKLQGVMRVRIRDDGVMTPIGLRFRPVR